MIIFGLGSLSIIIYYMKIKSYLWILFFHVIVSSGCGISKNPSTLIIDSPENSKVKKEVKDNLSHYHIIFAEKGPDESDDVNQFLSSGLSIHNLQDDSSNSNSKLN